MASWLSLVERWFAELTTKQIRRGVYRSVPQLKAAIQEFIDAHQENPKPFVWTKTADEILASIARFARADHRCAGHTTSVTNHRDRTLAPSSYLEQIPHSDLCLPCGAKTNRAVERSEHVPKVPATASVNGRPIVPAGRAAAGFS